MTPDRTELTAELLKLIANPTRIRIVVLLAEKTSLSVLALQAQLGIEQSLLSINLNKMKDRGVLTRQRKGREVHYSLADASLLEAIQIIVKRI